MIGFPLPNLLLPQNLSPSPSMALELKCHFIREDPSDHQYEHAVTSPPRRLLALDPTVSSPLVSPPDQLYMLCLSSASLKPQILEMTNVAIFPVTSPGPRTVHGA